MPNVLRQAVRYLARNPGFSLFAALGLALAIAGSTLVFAIGNAALHPHRNLHRPEQLATIITDRIGEGHAPYPDLLTPADLTALPSGLAARVALYSENSATLKTSTAQQRVRTVAVAGNFFDVLHAHAVRGRLLQPGDASLGDCPVVISAPLADRLFPGASALGRSLSLDGDACTVVGVSANDATYPEGTDVWTVARFHANETARFVGLFRLNAGDPVVLPRPFHMATITDANTRFKTSAFTGISLAVLVTMILALLNVATFYASRSRLRQREHAVRMALGASSAQVVQQAVSEVAVVAAGAVTASAVLMLWASRIAISALPELRLENTNLFDWRVAVFAAAISIGTTLIIAGSSVRTFLQRSSADMLREGAVGLTDTRGASTARRVSIAVQLAFIVMLMSLAAACVNYVQRIAALDVGIDASKVQVAGIGLEDGSAGDVDAASLLRAGRLATGTSASAPLAAWVARSAPFNAPGATARPLGSTKSYSSMRDTFMRYYEVTPQFFDVVGTRLVAGRALNESDTKNTQPVVVITKPAADRWWPGQSAIGRLVTFGSRSDLPAFTVVGVVENMQEPAQTGRWYVSIRPDASYPLAFIPWSQRDLPTQYVRQCLDCSEIYVGFRADEPDARVLRSLKDAMSEIVPGAQIKVGSLLDLQMGTYGFRENVITGRILTGFGAICALLGLIGIWALSEETVRQQMRELGVRAALGASPVQLLRACTFRNLGYGVIGAAAGTVLAVWAVPFAGRMIGLQPDAARTGVAVITRLAAAVVMLHVVATLVAARRSPFISPTKALDQA